MRKWLALMLLCGACGCGVKYDVTCYSAGVVIFQGTFERWDRVRDKRGRPTIVPSGSCVYIAIEE